MLNKTIKSFLKWLGIVLASIAGLILVFYLVSLFFGGDYDLTAKKMGTFLGSCLAGGTVIVLLLAGTEWLADKMVYSKVGMPNEKLSKTIYLAFILPFLCVLCATIFSLVMTRVVAGSRVGEWSEFDYVFTFFLFLGSLIFFLSEGIKKVKNPNEIAQAAESMNREAQKAFEKEDLDKARERCEKALRVWSLLPDDKYPQKANAYLTLGRIHFMEEQYEAARDDFEKGLTIRRAELGDNHGVIAAYYKLIARTFEGDLDFEDEIKYRRKALETLINTYGENHEETAEAYEQLALPISIWGERSEAVNCLEHALSIRQTLLSPNSLELLPLYFKIQAQYLSEKDYDMVREYAEKELLLKEQNYGPNHPELAGTYVTIGDTYLDQYDFQRATECFQRALDLRKDKLGEDDLDTGKSYFCIGRLHWIKGDYKIALEFFLTALRIFTNNSKDTTVDLTTSNIVVGQLYFFLGEYNKAQFYAESGLKIGQANLGNDDVDLADSYDTVGVTYYAKGDYAKAMTLFETAFDLREKHLSECDVDKALSYMNFGVVYQQQKEYQKALECFEKALSLVEKEKEDNPLNFSLCLNNMGEAYCSLERYDDALSRLSEAMKVVNSVKDRSYPLLGEVLCSLGKVYLGKKEYPKALDYFTKSICEWESMIGKDNPNVALVHYHIGRVYTQMGDYDRAREELDVAKGIQEFRLSTKHPDYLVTMEAIKSINE